MPIHSPFFEGDKPVVRQCVCLFADLLGFSARIRSCEDTAQSNELLGKLRDVIKERIAVWNDGGWEWKSRFFSDCLVLVSPIRGGLAGGEPELGSCLSDAAYYQLLMVCEGFPVRGGMTVGEAHLSEEMCFGKALVEAYDLERAAAIVPRVVLSAGVRSLVKKHLTWYSDPATSRHSHYVREDDDGHWFVNYLEAANPSGEGPDWSVLSQHRDFVAQSLGAWAGDPRVTAKYEWMREYHDYFCTSDRMCWSEEWSPPPGGREALMIRDQGPVSRKFKQIVATDAHALRRQCHRPL